jgi:hypothetical protein
VTGTHAPVTRPPGAVGQVRTEVDATVLARHLQDPERAWPVVVVSTPRERGRPYVDAGAVLDDVRGLAEVVIVHDGAASWAFSHGMPPGTQVYGGGSRVYPVGLEWVHDLERSHLWLAYDEARGADVRERLVQDALTAAARAGLAGVAAPPSSAAAHVEGTVLGVLGARALVQADDGGTLQVAEELTVPGVPLERLLTPGMRVRGVVLDPASGRLDVRGMLPDAAAQLSLVRAACPVGAVVPARVVAVADDAVTLALAPAVRVRVHRDRVTGNDLDVLGDLFSVGEVVIARVTPGAPVPGPAGAGGVAPGLRLDDVDEAEDAPLPAVRLLEDGPPWLGPPAAVVPEDDEVDAAESTSTGIPAPKPEHAAPAHPTPNLLARRPTSPASADSPPAPRTPAAAPRSGKGALNQLRLSLDEARSRATAAERETARLRAAQRTLELEVAGLRDYAQELKARLERRDERVEHLKTRLRKAEKAGRAAESRLVEGRADAALRRLFGDREEQLRYDVHRTWAETIAAEEKARYPLALYVVGPDFCASLDSVGRGLEEKVLRAVVMVLVDRAAEVPGYELHRLRRGEGGGDPYLVRETDGALAWRLALQVGTPSARRLHYWRLPGGGFELSRVVLHDDVQP